MRRARLNQTQWKIPGAHGSLQETGGCVGNLLMNAGWCEYYRQSGIEMERIIQKG